MSGPFGAAFLLSELLISAIKHTYHVYKNSCDIVFSIGQIHFTGLAFFDFIDISVFWEDF
jgi:hypothetical protein